MPKKKEAVKEEATEIVTAPTVEKKTVKKVAKKTKKSEVIIEEDATNVDVVESAIEVIPEESEEIVEHKSLVPNVKKYPHGKKYREVEKIVEKGKEYGIDEAIALLKKTATTKFDSSVEVHMNLNLDLTNPEHQIRGSVSMPSGLGKEKKICAIVSVDKQKEAKDAGADTVGGQDIIEKIEKGWLDFDVVIATPDMMPHIGKIGKTLGTKGLMPNPKTGTVTTDVERIIADIKKGKADYKVDNGGTVHASIGKVSFDDNKIKENLETFLSAIHNAKPASTKGTFVKSIFITTTMGPGIKITEK